MLNLNPTEPTARPGVEYYEGRSDGWDWFGTPRWWVKTIIWDDGFNGVGECVCRRLWRWNGSTETIRTDYGVAMPVAALDELART